MLFVVAAVVVPGLLAVSALDFDLALPPPPPLLGRTRFSRALTAAFLAGLMAAHAALPAATRAGSFAVVCTSFSGA